MCAKEINEHEISGEIINKPFSDLLSEKYLSYALSTIMSRSLPDVRDGLKPVHRRILYAMLQLKLDPKSGFKKCARVVGDVVGKYHPHGDVAVYDTLARLAQNFTLRYPLIHGQGNFGSIDGDNPAAMRYTESKLTEIAQFLLKDIDKETVDFKSTYDGLESEPLVLPASFPNLLANGAEGIAVGMATSIPPHNIEELCTSLLKLIKNRDIKIEDLITDIIGPDFPTGGILFENNETILSAYKSGRGSLRIRAKWEKEMLKFDAYQIAITEIPYQIQKSKLIEKIAELYKDKKLALLGNVRDESAEDIRIILEPKNRFVDPEMLMESMFKLTDLETRFNLNMNALDKDSIPRIMNLKEVLLAFLDHREEVVLNRTKYELSQVNHRIEVLEGLLIAYLNLDEIINIIREEDDPKSIFINKFKLTDIQAESILNIRLRSLRKLEEIEIKKEYDSLLSRKKDLEEILQENTKRWQIIADEIKEVQKRFGKNTAIGKRRTTVAKNVHIAEIISIEAFIEKEPITVIYSEKGWIKTVSGHIESSESIKFKEDDNCKFIIPTYTTEKIILFSKSGRFFTINSDKLPRGKGFGSSIRLIVDLDANDDILTIIPYKADIKLLLASSSGKGMLVNIDDTISKITTGKQIFNLKDNETAICCLEVDGDYIATIGSNRKLLVFAITDMPLVKRGQGVILQKYKEAKLSDIKIFNKNHGLEWQKGKNIIIEKDITSWLGKRGNIGKIPPLGFPKNNKFFN